MKAIIKCPDCGKDLKITVEEVAECSYPIVRRMEEIKPSINGLPTWDDISGMLTLGGCDPFFGGLRVGDEIDCTLKDGTDVTFVVAHIDPYGENEAAFVLKDCLPERHVMNKEWTNKGGWRDSDMRKHLKEKIYPLLPDELKAHIVTRTIVQEHNGEELKSDDDIWLLSETEVFGCDDDYESDVDIGDVHFDLFCDERSRVKQIDGETVLYSLRSPWSSNAAPFANVSGNGGESNSSASNSYGVSFGFLFK